MPPTEDPALTIGQVAERAGLNTSHIRFYERAGVLPQPERVSGQRRYHPEVLHRLSIIEVAQRAGLKLEEIAPLTGPDNRSADASMHLRALAAVASHDCCKCRACQGHGVGSLKS
jgi:DNA-binding transcriptional MerR regulator